nr:IS5 family transposase [Sporolactobacillus spathodeae]
MTIEDFSTPLPLDPDNRWVRWASMIPWDQLNKTYSALFKKNGHPAYNVRVAVGSLLVKQLLNLSDEGTVRAISESHYLQFFIGLPSFTLHCPFDASTLTRFRKRLADTTILRTANEYLIQNAERPEKDESNKDDDPPSNDGPKGTMIVDATCAPSDIAFPTDVRLLHVTRIHLEKLIDELWNSSFGKKPRTRRRQARMAYLRFARNRKPSSKKVRQAVRQQLGYVKRDLAFISQLTEKDAHLFEKQEQIINTAQLIYEQQNEMYRTKKHRVDHRIVSFDQPYVRPIQRGKAKAATEFGPKFEITVIDGYTRLSKLSWENYNESQFLIEKIEAYHQSYDHYPARVLADKIYATRANRQFCKSKGIHLQGPPLGRPRKVDDLDKKIHYQDSCERNQVESKFGTLKTFHGLERLCSRLKETSELEIELAILGLNLCKRARSSFVALFNSLFFSFKVRINGTRVTLIMR